MIILLIVMMLPVLFYIPAVQRFATDIAVKEVKKSTGMDISVGELRIRYPLRVELADVSVMEAGVADTMIVAKKVSIDVAVLPLLRLDIHATGLEGEGIGYRLGTPDSLLYLTARVDNVKLNSGDIALRDGRIEVDKARVEGARVRLVIQPDTTVTPTDTTTSKPWLIKAHEIEMVDLSYSMKMEPLIDSIGAFIGSARLVDGVVDMARHDIHATYMTVDSVTASYFYPLHPTTYPEPAVAPTDTVASEPWTVRADSLSLTARRALYAASGAIPAPGLDMNYLEVRDVAIKVKDFYNRGVEIRVPLERLSATERCGLALEASGVFSMDSTAMHADSFNIRTNNSTLTVERALMGIGNLATDPDLPVALDAFASVSPGDILMTFPAMQPMLGSARGKGAVKLTADLKGTPARLDVGNIALNAFNVLRLHARGSVDNVMDPQRIGGRIALDGSITDGSALTRILPASMLPTGLHIPSMTLKGNVDYAPGAVKGNIAGTTHGGRLALDGKWVARSEGYDADLWLDAFPVDAFMPSLGVGPVTAVLKAKGHGYNPKSLATTMDVDLDVKSVVYNGQKIEGVRLDAVTGGGQARGTLSSSSPSANLDLDFNATMKPEDYSWNLDGDIRHLDLQSLKLYPDSCQGSLRISSVGSYDPRDGSIDGSLSLDDISWTLPGLHISTPSATAKLKTTPGSVSADLRNGDLSVSLLSDHPLDSLLSSMTRISAEIDSIVKSRRADIVALQKALPPMELEARIGDNNLLASLLGSRGTGFSTAYLDFHNDSLLTLSGYVRNFTQGITTIDSIDINAYQRGKNLVYTAEMNNSPGTMDNFAHVRLNGFLADNRLSAFLTQSNISGEQGFNIGLLVSTVDSVMTARFVPSTPTLAYRKFEINKDNYLKYNFINNRIQADMSLSDGKTTLDLYTEPGETPEMPEDLIVHIAGLQLADYLTLSPFAPPIKGEAGADIRVRYTDKVLTGRGNINLDNFYYDRRRVGSIAADMNLFTDPASGFLKADVDLAVDSVKTMTLTGVLNDSTSATPMRLDLNVTRFPLRVANPFIPVNVASIDGNLNGHMSVTGEMSRPVFNGYLQFDSTVVKVAMIGTNLLFSDERIPVKDSQVTFDDFTITAANENPLYVNGGVDISDLANVGLNLNLYANDIQVVNSNRPRGADVYGKGFLDINANVKGNMKFMVAHATVDLLPGSNVTYVLSSAASSAITSPSSTDMVHFVSFNDSTAVQIADSINTSPMALILDANLIVSEGSTLNVDLSTSNNDKVTIQGNGNLNYTQSPINPGRLTGRFNINSGLVRYTPPVIVSEKTFNFEDGSYVAFNGDMMNPTLNIHAYDDVKANVTRQGENSRLVDFRVSLAVTGTLETMNVSFDLSTNDDITVSNELASMSPEQRANQAMNLLLYGVYSSNGTNGNANLGGNILYTFVESTLNNWMASNIKAVDISFGIDQYDKTYNGSTSTATNYSYHVSKTLFNDRFKIVVGGTYSTDNEGSDESVAESLINDISAEYMLNRAGTMYVKIFRHTGYESILEGEVTQTGVGFVYKRRLHSLWEFFVPQRKLSNR